MHSDVVCQFRAQGWRHGLCSKSAPVDELLTAVKRVSAGKYYVDSELAGSMILGNASPDAAS
jgi:DNA-binding NarL/FixJ family response regulator